MLLNRPCEHGRLTACHCRLSRRRAVCAWPPLSCLLWPLCTWAPISVRCWTRCWLAYINMYRGVSKYQIHMLQHNSRTFRSEVKVRLWLGLLRFTYEGCTKTFTTTDLDSFRHMPVPPHKAENNNTDFREIWHWWEGLLIFFQYPPIGFGLVSWHSRTRGVQRLSQQQI